MLWLCINTFNAATPPPKTVLLGHEPTSGWRVTQPSRVYVAKCDPAWADYLVWQTRQPALADYFTYHVNARLKK